MIASFFHVHCKNDLSNSLKHSFISSITYLLNENFFSLTNISCSDIKQVTSQLSLKNRVAEVIINSIILLIFAAAIIPMRFDTLS
jgi:hypothetical protein